MRNVWMKKVQGVTSGVCMLDLFTALRLRLVWRNNTRLFNRILSGLPQANVYAPTNLLRTFELTARDAHVSWRAISVCE